MIKITDPPAIRLAGRTHLGMDPLAVQHPGLTPVYESLVKTASALLLAFELDLASVAVSLARRVRTASQTEESESVTSDLGSILGGMESLQSRLLALPEQDSIPGLSLALAWTKTCKRSIATQSQHRLIAA